MEIFQSKEFLQFPKLYIPKNFQFCNLKNLAVLKIF